LVDRDFVDINVGTKEYVHAMTMSGSKVKAWRIWRRHLERWLWGRSSPKEKHPNADKLKVSKVDIGTEKLHIVTGAPNVKEGDLIPLALVWAPSFPTENQAFQAQRRGVLWHDVLH
jgi:phenylalanyl-tRNA synthetase beta chain